jgi:phosphate transport system substrate-binding protein
MRTMKLKNKTGYAALLAGIALLFLYGCGDAGPKKIVIKGSTTVLPIMQNIANAYRETSKTTVYIEGSGSGLGIKSLIEGKCDIADSSRPIKQEEISASQTGGLEITEILIAYDMVVPVVHPSNRIENLSLDQLKSIYNGSIKNWKEVGGKNENITVVSRDLNSGTYEVWNEKVMKNSILRADAFLQVSNETVLETVAENARAIGYLGYGNINKSVKTVKVNGLEESIENGKSGVYPLSRKLYLYVNKKKINKEIQKFTDYVIGKEGQKIVTSTGFISL